MQLRLQEARQLLVTEALDAPPGPPGLRDAPSQLSREYSRSSGRRGADRPPVIPARSHLISDHYEKDATSPEATPARSARASALVRPRCALAAAMRSCCRGFESTLRSATSPKHGDQSPSLYRPSATRRSSSSRRSELCEAARGVLPVLRGGTAREAIEKTAHLHGERTSRKARIRAAA